MKLKDLEFDMKVRSQDVKGQWWDAVVTKVPSEFVEVSIDAPSCSHYSRLRLPSELRLPEKPKCESPSA